MGHPKPSPLTWGDISFYGQPRTINMTIDDPFAHYGPPLSAIERLRVATTGPSETSTGPALFWSLSRTTPRSACLAVNTSERDISVQGCRRAALNAAYFWLMHQNPGLSNAVVSDQHPLCVRADRPVGFHFRARESRGERRSRSYRELFLVSEADQVANELRCHSWLAHLDGRCIVPPDGSLEWVRKNFRVAAPRIESEPRPSRQARIFPGIVIPRER